MNREQRKRIKIKDLKAILAENVLIYKEKDKNLTSEDEQYEKYENLYQGNLYSVPDWLLNKSIKVMYPAKEKLTEILVE